LNLERESNVEHVVDLHNATPRTDGRTDGRIGDAVESGPRD